MQTFPNVFKDYRLDFEEIRDDVSYFVNELVLERAKRFIQLENTISSCPQFAEMEAVGE